MTDLIANFFAGALLCNCVPHAVCGLKGEPFPTPFATPHGVGNSPPLVNFLWGFFNLLAGLALLAWKPVPLNFSDTGVIALLAGVLLMGLFAAWHFGKVRAGSHSK